MPSKYRVNYSRRAADQIEKIVDYISESSPDTAAHFAERIIKAIESLERFPQRYNLVRAPKTIGRTIRSMPIRPFLIRYLIDDKTLTVSIVSIRHGARRPGL